MNFIKRQLLSDIFEHLDKPEITLIVGARQAGKTTLLSRVRDMLHQQGQNTLFLNLDFETDYFYLESQEKLLQKIRLEFGQDGGYVFLDEIQRKENAGLFLKGLYDMGLPYKFIVSGSGSMELKEKIHESLAGRKRVFELATISLWEFLQFKTAYTYEDRLLDFCSLEGEKARLMLEEYLSYGGYPRIVVEEQGRERLLLMNEIYESYLKKDIVYLLKLDRPDVFTRFIRLCAHSCGSIINYNTLANDAGLSVPTVKKYLWYAEQTFVIKTVTPFFKNKRKELKKSPTLYFTDLGLRNFALRQMGQDISAIHAGRLFQNLIYLILGEITRKSMHAIHYWRTSDLAEVDFVLVRRHKPIPMEVKYSHLRAPKMTRSLRSFIDSYTPDVAYVINLSYKHQIKINETVVRFIPYYELYGEQL